MPLAPVLQRWPGSAPAPPRSPTPPPDLPPSAVLRARFAAARAALVAGAQTGCAELPSAEREACLKQSLGAVHGGARRARSRGATRRRRRAGTRKRKR
jgi:hypothetical protein